MMKSFAERLIEDQRLVILRLLHDQEDWSLNASLLQDGLLHLSHKVSRDDVMALIGWLAEKELVTVYDESSKSGSYRIVTLTETGSFVAAGRTRVEGVKTPHARRPPQGG